MKKNIVLMILLSVIIFACTTSNQDIAKKNIEAHLLKQMNDAKSYEFVELDSLRFYSKFDSVKIELELAEKENLIYKGKVDGLNELKEIELRIAKIKNANSTFELEQVNKEIEENNKKISDLDLVINNAKNELTNENLKKELVEYRTNIKFRGKNSMGALVLNSAYVRLDKDFNIISMNINNQ